MDCHLLIENAAQILGLKRKKEDISLTGLDDASLGKASSSIEIEIQSAVLDESSTESTLTDDDVVADNASEDYDDYLVLFADESSNESTLTTVIPLLIIRQLIILAHSSLCLLPLVSYVQIKTACSIGTIANERLLSVQKNAELIPKRTTKPSKS